MGVGLDAPDDVGEGVGGDVRTDDAHHLAALVMDGNGIAHHVRQAADVVVIRLAPYALFCRHSRLIPFHLEVVVFRTSHLLGNQRVTTCLVSDVDFVPVPLLGIVVLLEGDTRTHDAGTGLYGVACDIEHGIGIVKGVFHQRLHGIHHGLNLPQASENHVFGFFQRVTQIMT